MPGGRPRKPTKLKLIEGNRGKRKIKPEPEPALGIPVAHKMPPAAQAVWDGIAPELDRLGLLAKIDGTALEAACRGVAQGRAADDAIEKLQELIRAGTAERNDYYHLSMLMAASKKGWSQWRAFCTEFGLTPASRSKLSVPENRQSDPLDDAMFA